MFLLHSLFSIFFFCLSSFSNMFWWTFESRSGSAEGANVSIAATCCWRRLTTLMQTLRLGAVLLMLMGLWTYLAFVWHKNASLSSANVTQKAKNIVTFSQRWQRNMNDGSHLTGWRRSQTQKPGWCAEAGYVRCCWWRRPWRRRAARPSGRVWLSAPSLEGGGDIEMGKVSK